MWMSSISVVFVSSYCKLVLLLKIQYSKRWNPHTVSSSWTSFCLTVCGEGSKIVLVSWPLLFPSLKSGSCFLMSSDQTQITLICQWPELQGEAQKPFYLFFFLLALALFQTHKYTHSRTSAHLLCSNLLLCQFGLSEGVKYGCNYWVLWVPRVWCFTPQC